MPMQNLISEECSFTVLIQGLHGVRVQTMHKCSEEFEQPGRPFEMKCKHWKCPFIQIYLVFNTYVDD
jgi:hypothetical protein